MLLNTVLRRLSALLPLTALVGGLLVLIAARPSNDVQACQPCSCEVGTTVNCYGNYALFTPSTRNGSCRIDIYRLQDNVRGRRIISVTQAEQDDLPEFPEENTLIEEVGDVALYKLTSGEYQINNGPDEEGKVHVIIWRGCPAEDVRESTFTVQAPAAAESTEPAPTPAGD
ncbi:MAG: hypothetical protein SF029_07235 [bacterium]|nr:hypothetical protein [bacterium]